MMHSASTPGRSSDGSEKKLQISFRNVCTTLSTEQAIPDRAAVTTEDSPRPWMARYAGQPVAGSGTIATHSESDAVVCVKRSGGTSVAPNALKGTE